MVSINGIVVGNEKYPNNESIFRAVNPSKRNYVEFRLTYENDLDMFTLYMYARYMEDKYPSMPKYLLMDYIPYSRMDREIFGYIFSAKYLCKMINELSFDKVLVLDPHSNVSTAILDRCLEYDIQPNIEAVFDSEYIDYVFYPDNGAMKRYSEALALPVPYFYGNKKRNLQTGKIEKFELVDAPDLNGKTILIIDDLCAFGGTFIKSAEEIKNNGASKVVLYVSHCENSIYKGELLKTNFVDKVYTTDSILQDFSSDKIEKLG